MGRPINKRYFGATGNDAAPNLPVRYHNGTASVEGYIVNQKGTNKFTVTTDGNTNYVCRLVQEANPNAAAEMSLVGLTADGPVILKKMFNRTAVDWSGNRYTWELEDDSTESLIRLTAI